MPNPLKRMLTKLGRALGDAQRASDERDQQARSDTPPGDQPEAVRNPWGPQHGSGLQESGRWDQLG